MFFWSLKPRHGYKCSGRLIETIPAPVAVAVISYPRKAGMAIKHILRTKSPVPFSQWRQFHTRGKTKKKKAIIQIQFIFSAVSAIMDNLSEIPWRLRPSVEKAFANWKPKIVIDTKLRSGVQRRKL